MHNNWYVEKQKCVTAANAVAETIVYTSSFSPNGKVFVFGTSWGDIFYWDLATRMTLDWYHETASERPSLSWKAHDGPVYTLAFHGDLLLSGGDDCIYAWNWRNFAQNPNPSFVPVFQIKPQPDHIYRFTDRPEINGISIDSSRNLLYAATGDLDAYCWDIETKKLVTRFKGHRNYLHTAKVMPITQQLATGAEDGTVRLWDTRTGATTKLLDCANGCVVSDVPSYHYDTWVSAIAIDPAENWMVCGGGNMTTSIWYLATPSIYCYLPSPGVTHDITFSEDGTIYTGGGVEAWLYHWEFSGKVKPRLPTSCKSIFSVSVNPNPDLKVVAACGTSPYVDIFTCLYGHKIFSLYSASAPSSETKQTTTSTSLSMEV